MLLMLQKIAVLRRVSSSLNKQSRALVYKTWVKPYMENSFPLWTYCGGEEARFDKVSRDSQASHYWQ